MSSLKSARRKAKGIALSTEMLLLITALIALAVISFYGLSKTVIQQAQSTKHTVIITRAEATIMEQGCPGSKAILAVSLYVQNTGNEKVTIHHILVRVKDGNSLKENYTIVHVTLEPGETKVLSRVIMIKGACVRPEDPVYVAVVADSNEVGTVVRALEPP